MVSLFDSSFVRFTQTNLILLMNGEQKGYVTCFIQLKFAFVWMWCLIVLLFIIIYEDNGRVWKLAFAKKMSVQNCAL